MKNFILKKWILMLACLFVGWSAMAENYEVSGAGTPELNGIYAEVGTANGKPYYEYLRQYYCFIRHDGTYWTLGIYMGSYDVYYRVESTDATPPADGWVTWGGTDPVPTVTGGATGYFSGGSGSSSSPFLISKVKDLIDLSKDFMYWNNAFYFQQISDIDFGDDETLVDWNGDGSATWTDEDTLGFIPLGNSSHPFKARYYGQGYSINHLYINRSKENNIGFFGDLQSSVSKIGLLNVDITGTQYVGALAGIAENNIDSCYSSGNVTGYSPDGGMYGNPDHIGGLVGYYHKLEMTNSFSVANVTGYDKVGGLIGYNGGTVEGCHSAGDVNGHSNVGGLIGHIQTLSPHTITYNYSSSDVTSDGDNTGGFAGGSYSIYWIASCHSTGNVTSTGECTGGFIGYYQNIITPVYFEDCYSRGNVSGPKYTGGFEGYHKSGTTGIKWCYSTGTVTGSSNTGGFVGYSPGLAHNQCYFLNTAGPDNYNCVPQYCPTDLTYSQMQNLSNYVGFRTWSWQRTAGVNDGYPYSKLYNSFCPRLSGAATALTFGTKTGTSIEITGWNAPGGGAAG